MSNFCVHSTSDYWECTVASFLAPDLISQKRQIQVYSGKRKVRKGIGKHSFFLKSDEAKILESCGKSSSCVFVLFCSCYFGFFFAVYRSVYCGL